MSWYAIVRDFQIMITGLFGFAGVIMTLICNRYLTQRAAHATVDRDRAALCAALFEELKIIKAAFGRGIDAVAEAQAGGVTEILLPTDIVSDVYSRLLDRIGLLNPEELGKIVEAYLIVRQISSNLGAQSRTDLGATAQGAFIRISVENFERAKRFFRSASVKVDDAIHAVGAARSARR